MLIRPPKKRLIGEGCIRSCLYTNKMLNENMSYHTHRRYKKFLTGSGQQRHNRFSGYNIYDECHLYHFYYNVIKSSCASLSIIFYMLSDSIGGIRSFNPCLTLLTSVVEVTLLHVPAFMLSSDARFSRLTYVS